MAFSPVNIQLTQLLDSSFITDIPVVVNSNDIIIRDTVQDLINNFQIDVQGLSIGTDTPLNYIKTDSLIIEDTGFIFQTGNPLTIISQLYKDSNSKSNFDVDFINCTDTITTSNINTTTLLTTDALTVNNDSILSGKVSFGSSVVKSKESITVNISDVSSVSTGNLLLSNTSRNLILTTLQLDSTVYDPATTSFLVTSDINLVIDFDATNPPDINSEFSIIIYDIVDSLGNSIINDVVSNSINILIKPGTNNNTSNAIILHSDYVANGINFGIQSTNIKKFNSSATFYYLQDTSSNDVLFIANQYNMDTF